MAALPEAPQKTYLVQKFAKLHFGQFSVLGYSVAGEETVVCIPELNVAFDAGRAPQFAVVNDYLCISHAHMDHVAGLGYYVSQRNFQGMKPPTILAPESLCPQIDSLLRVWEELERQKNPYDLVPMRPGQLFEVRKDFGIRAVETHHGRDSLGYVLLSIREKLKPEYADVPGEKLAEMKAAGTEIQYRLEVPLVAYLGDTTPGPVFENPEVKTAQVLLTECTFFDAEHRRKAKIGKHTHVDDFADILQNLENEHVVVLHVSRRISTGKARHLLRKRLSDEKLARVHLLMDFRDSAEAGAADEILSST
ncbi:MAG: MBL fold metallo-hydrolase [Phycisphaerae bacterium]